MARAITFQRSLFWNLTVSIIILVPVFLLVAARIIEDTEVRLANELTDRAVTDTKHTVGLFFQPVGELVAMSARHFADVGVDLDDPERLDRYFMPILAAFERVSGASLGDDGGRSYTLKRTANGWERRESDPDGNPGRMLVTRWTDGNPERVSEWLNVAYDARTRPWFEDAMASPPPAERDPAYSRGAVSWSRPYEFPMPVGRHGVTASMAYEPPEGSVDVIALDVLLRDVSSFTMGLVLKDSGSVAVLYGDEDSEELVLIGLPAGLSDTSEEALESLLLAPPSAIGGPLVDYVDAVASAPVGERLLPRRFESDGDLWWGAGARYASPVRLPFSVLIVAIVPQEELVGQVQQLAFWVIIATLLMATVMVWRSSRLSRNYARSLEDLVGQTESMAGLNFEKGREIKTRIEEIRMLAQAQEQMRRSFEAISSRDEPLLIARSMRAEEKLVSGVAREGYGLGVLDQCAEAVGGGLFDAAVHPDSDARFSMLLAVVPGEGVAAAYEAGRVRSVFQAGVRLNTTLEEQVRQIRSHFASRPDLQEALAVCVAEVDGDEATLAVLSDACPVVHFSASSGTFRWVELAPTPTRIALGEGDTVVLLTESVLRALSPARMPFGREGLEEAVRAHSEADAETLARSIGAALDRFTDATPPERDRTLLTVRRAAAGRG